MPSYRRPGVYFEETISPAEAVTSTNLSAGAFLASNPRGPVVAQRVTSWTQYMTYFGGFFGINDLLPFAVFEFFSNGGREAWVARVAGSGAAPATKVLVDRATPTPANTMTVTAANPGVWGNSLYVDVVDVTPDRFSLVVKLGGAGDAYTVERWLDLSMDPTDSRYAPALVNATSGGSPYIRVTDMNSATTAPGDRPAIQTGTALAGGNDGGTVAAADLGAALPVFDSVDMPLALNLPGHSGAAVGTALSYAAARGDVFVVVDPPQGNDVATVLTYAGGLTATSFGAMYYPWVQVADPASSAPGAMRTIPPGGAVIGQYATTDASRGVFKTPAGINTRISGAVGVERRLTGAELDSLNMANVNAIRQIPGAGIVIMGGRTLKLSGSDKYISVRRTLIYIRSSLISSTRFAVFEPNDDRLWLVLRSMIERFLLDLWQQGGLRGTTADAAFFVKCDDELNTPQSVAAGEVKVQIGVALQYPAEFVVFTLSQREVGATVTVQV
jgi:phage tail sheath protein FI